MRKLETEREAFQKTEADIKERVEGESKAREELLRVELERDHQKALEAKEREFSEREEQIRLEQREEQKQA